MKRFLAGLFSLLLILFALGGCSSAGSKTDSFLGVYVATAVISLLIPVFYFGFIKKRDLWFILLLVSVFIVNAGYLSLAISTTLEEALLANRISYLGSVFLPMSMLMIIINNTKIRYTKALPVILLCVGVIIFLIAATPGYCDIYYKEVSLITTNGVSSLSKIYGPWHISYLIYLFAYFSSMVAIVAFSAVKKTTTSTTHSVILALAVVVNIGVWLLEQLVEFDFEFLSISYIITELFLFGLRLIIQDEEKRALSPPPVPEKVLTENTVKSEQSTTDVDTEHLALFIKGIATLTPTERAVFDLYIEGNGTKDVMSKLNIKENTLKYHNKNIYGKLCIASRKQLLEFAKAANLQAENQSKTF